MVREDHLGNLVDGLTSELKDVYASSSQGIYLYLDDLHKSCNEKFASMLGYESARSWAAVRDPFTSMVDPKSQNTLVSAYQKAMETGEASKFPVIWKKKSGGRVNTTVILVPISYRRHMYALHFVS